MQERKGAEETERPPNAFDRGVTDTAAQIVAETAHGPERTAEATKPLEFEPKPDLKPDRELETEPEPETEREPEVQPLPESEMEPEPEVQPQPQSESESSKRKSVTEMSESESQPATPTDVRMKHSHRRLPNYREYKDIQEGNTQDSGKGKRTRYQPERFNPY